MQCVYATVPPPNMALPMAKLKATWSLYLINLWAVNKLVRTHLCVLRILNAVVCVCACACACVCVCVHVCVHVCVCMCVCMCVCVCFILLQV